MDFIKSILPTLATALAGPLAGGAAAFFADKLGLPDKTVDAVVNAVRGADPAQILEMKRIDAELKKTYVEAGVRIEEVAAADRASARKREVATGDRTPRNLAYLYGFAFFAVIIAQIFMGIHGIVMPSGVEKTLDMLLGVLTGMVLGSKEYYFGTSAGSVQKTELLARDK
jgi:hypothetical protein